MVSYAARLGHSGAIQKVISVLLVNSFINRIYS